MNEKLDPILQEIADKVLHDLPEELAAGMSFKVHEGGDGLILNYPSNLEGTPDFNTVNDVVLRFRGAWVSRGKGRSHFVIPKPKPKTAEPKKAKETPRQPDPALPAAVAVSSAKNEDNTLLKSDEKLRENPKQHSPISIFQKDQCSKCADPCGPVGSPDANFRIAWCMQASDLTAQWAKVTEIKELRAELAKFMSVFSMPPGAKLTPAAAPIQDEISWVWDKNENNEVIQKAFEKDNLQSKNYAKIRQLTAEAQKTGRKGALLCGKWYSLSKDGDYINCRDFGAGR